VLSQQMERQWRGSSGVSASVSGGAARRVAALERMELCLAPGAAASATGGTAGLASC
jgi:hypothetical protein